MDIAFAADKGGVGKSTLAYHMATRLRQLGRDVALLDLDRRGACSHWIEMADDPYLSAYRMEELIGNLPEHEIRIWDTPAHPSRELRRSLAQGCDLIVVVVNTDIDSTMAGMDLWKLFSREGATATIVVNGVHPTSTIGEEHLAAFRRENVPSLPVCIRRYACYERARWDGQAVCDGPYSSADNAWADISKLTEAIVQEVQVDHAAA